MATAKIVFRDNPNETVDVRVTFGPHGTDETSGAHHCASAALAAVGKIAKGEISPIPLDLVAHLYRQREFSQRTFGPGARVAGVVEHIRRELVEIEANPGDVSEWIDVVLLAFDGAWRAGFTPEQIARALTAKQVKNEARDWPDWRTAAPDQPIEHVRVATPT